ncbi:MAG: 50S ribosomal protein L4, partial [Chloroflexota bacterium]|nr:50S ribosomal protein L4 [Chloroflexota bacterium]
MASTSVLSAKGTKKGSIELADSLFGAPVRSALIHQAAMAQLDARRVGTADTLTRAQVRGGGRKPWRQKGTG